MHHPKLSKGIQILARSSPAEILREMRNKKGNLGMAAYDLVFIESGRQDSNLRPSAPKAPALQFETVT